MHIDAVVFRSSRASTEDARTPPLNEQSSRAPLPCGQSEPTLPGPPLDAHLVALTSSLLSRELCVVELIPAELGLCLFSPLLGFAEPCGCAGGTHQGSSVMTTTD